MSQPLTATFEVTQSELVARFEALNDAAICFVQDCPVERWRALTVEEGWRAGVTVHHIGAIHYPVIDQVQAMIDGLPLTVTTMTDVERLNAQHVREHAECTPLETVAFLKQEGQRVREWLRTIGETDLVRAADIPFMGGWTTAVRLLQVVLIDLANGHLRSALAATRNNP